jgi:hypothetical protein
MAKKKIWTYDAYQEVSQSPAKECIAFADLTLRETPQDPDSITPPKAKGIGKIKAGTKFKCDALGLMGNANTPSDEASGKVRAIWYHVPPSSTNAAGWVLGYWQAPANSGKIETYVGVGEDGLLTWAGMKGAKDLAKSPSTSPSTSPTAAPPYTQKPVDSPAGVNPLLIVAVLAAVYFLTRKN